MRSQQTIQSEVVISGIGFFTGADVSLKLLPADENTGVLFQRTDLPDQPVIPAVIHNVTSASRHTVLECEGSSVRMTEHIMAALAGLQIDNCLIELYGPELPGLDGSSHQYVDSILDVGIVRQSAPKPCFRLHQTIEVNSTSDSSRLVAREVQGNQLKMTYRLNYGNSPIPIQEHSCRITPSTFTRELASARTFVMESEVEMLRQQGIGLRHSAKDVLVWNEEGVIDNELRFPNECARHKLLDCMGDFALLGVDLIGDFLAIQSGHHLNHELIRRLVKEMPSSHQYDVDKNRNANRKAG